MPFNYLLTNLLVDVPQAVGAIFVDPEGEAVEWVTRHNDPFDLKVIAPARHERYTARDNRQILHNLAELVRRRVPLEVRMPVVPERNTDARNLAAIARLLTDLGVGSLTLLPYNHLWEAKLPRLATTRVPLGIQPPGDDFYDGLQAEFARLGLATHR